MQAGLIKPLWYQFGEHLYKLMKDTEYRRYHTLASRIGDKRRFSECELEVSDWKLSIPDAASFLSAYKEIFVDHIYAFKSTSEQPRILDLGANIGLSVLYFKQLYPGGEITAFEADPMIFGHLEKNVHGNGFRDVSLINKAVWDENSIIRFNSEGADGGRVAIEDDKNIISVESVDIREILNRGDYDFLKMDIEGAEERVFPACKDFLPSFKFVFVEYHSIVGKKQSLDVIISLLTDAGFRIYIQNAISSLSPFSSVHINSGFDLQLNIFAWKE